MKPFRQRNPVKVAIVGIVVVGTLLGLAFNSDKLPFIGNGPTYHADFAEIGDLHVDDAVRIAGIKVGAVDGFHLSGAHVVVTFHVNGAHFGPDTTATIELKTLLGADYLALHPAGNGQLRSGGTIPLSHTTPAYEVVPAFSKLTTTVQDIDTTKLATALSTLAGTFRNTPASIRGALDGLTRLSKTIASRDDEVSTLLAHANSVTGVLAGNSKQIVQIVNSTNQVLQVLDQRSQVIDELLVQSQELAKQLSGLVKDNTADLAPALKSLNTVLDVLVSDKSQLSQSIALLKPFLHVFTNALGTGGYFDTTINFGSSLAVCDNSTSGSSPLNKILDPVLSALNKASTGGSQPCLPLAAPTLPSTSGAGTSGASTSGAGK
jgi:phospholipid/cholesterol/gamma-HCH transport system substrate-binding protein